MIALSLFCNASAQWHWQNPYPQSNHLYGLCFVDSLNGWAVGDGGTILSRERNTSTGIVFEEINENDYTIEIWPNPFTGIFNVNFIKPTAEAVEISVYDLSGKLLINQKYNILNKGNRSVEINMLDFPEGVYFCTVGEKNRSETFKIIKISH